MSMNQKLTNLFDACTTMAQGIAKEHELIYPFMWTMGKDGRVAAHVLNIPNVNVTTAAKLVAIATKATHVALAVEAWVGHLDADVEQDQEIQDKFRRGELRASQLPPSQRMDMLWVMAESNWGQRLDRRWIIHPEAAPGLSRTLQDYENWEEQGAVIHTVDPNYNPWRPLIPDPAAARRLLGNLGGAVGLCQVILAQADLVDLRTGRVN
jgi:hypothetical protein